MAHPSPHCQHPTKIQHPNSIGEIFRSYSETYITQYQPNLPTIQLIRNIRKCRSPAMGSTRITCKGCGETKYLYKSCGDNKCPIPRYRDKLCQSIKRLQCQDKISQKMLNVPYVHLTFTLPHELNSLLRANPKALYGLLYRSSWKTIQTVCADSNNVGGSPGMIAIIHTWGADMKYHVHLHTLITFGGLDKEDNWQHPKRKDKLARYRQINRIFKETYLKGIQKLLKKKALKEMPMLKEILDEVEKKTWVVNNGKPQVDTKNIEEYLSRYINKIAISNSSLTFNQAKEQVELIHNDYKNQIAGEAAPKKVKTFDPLSFIHQFLQHLPPKHFQRLRYYGLHASSKQAKVKGKIPEKLKRNGATVRTVMQIIRALLGVQLLECEKCGGVEFGKSIEKPDPQWLAKNVRGFNPRASPNQLKNKPSCSNASLEKSTHPTVANGKRVAKKRQNATNTAS
ncbi:MAG: transposase [Chitinophagales bacterium]